MEIKQIIGKRVLAIKSWPDEKQPSFIMFDDEETYIYLDDQDYYVHHDCSTSAKEVTVEKDRERWFTILTYPDATKDI